MATESQLDRIEKKLDGLGASIQQLDSRVVKLEAFLERETLATERDCQGRHERANGLANDALNRHEVLERSLGKRIARIELQLAKTGGRDTILSKMVMVLVGAVITIGTGWAVYWITQ